MLFTVIIFCKFVNGHNDLQHDHQPHGDQPKHHNHPHVHHVHQALLLGAIVLIGMKYEL